jgi:hypothetical protein
MRCKTVPCNIQKKVAIVEEISGIQEQLLKTVCFISHGSDKINQNSLYEAHTLSLQHTLKFHFC